MRIVCRMTTGFDRVARVCQDLEDVQLIEATSESETAAAVHGAHGLITFASVYTEAVAAAVRHSSLGWVHLLTAGVDPLTRCPLPAGIKLSSGGRVWAKPVAEHALAMLLALNHHLPLALRAQTEGAWLQQRFISDMRTLRDRDVLLIGFGAIGQQIARLLTPFGAGIRAVARTGRTQCGVAVLPPALLGEAITQCDAVIVAVPYSSATRGLIGGAELAHLRPGCVLINVSRGGVVDEQALLRALQNGALAAAALDVFEVEPLPSTHPFRALPNLLLTPHVAGFGDAAALDEMASICRANLQDFIHGRELRDGFVLRT